MGEPGFSLYLPTKVAEEVAAERRARELQRGPPIQVVPRGRTIQGLGRQPSKQELLAENKGWAAIATRPIADRIMDLDYSVTSMSMGMDEPESIPMTHPLTWLLNNPGPVFSKQMLLRITVYHMLIAGEAYWQKVTNGMSQTVQLWPLPTQFVQPIIGGGSDIVVGYEITPESGTTVVLPAEEVIRIWQPDPETLYTSIGALGPQREEWDAQRALVDVQRAHFESGATPDVAIKAEVGAQLPIDDEKEAFYADWGQRYNMRSGKNRGLPAFIPPGFDTVEFDQHGNINSLDPTSKQFAQQFLAAWGVPGSIVGQDTDVNRATAEANQYVFDLHTVEPLTSMIGGALTMQLAHDFDESITIGFEDFVAPDKEFKQRQEAQDLSLKVRSINEVREHRGIDESEWGDDPVGTIADVPYRPDEAFAANVAIPDLNLPRSVGSPVPADSRAPSRSLPTARGTAAIWARQTAAERRWQRLYARETRKVWEQQRLLVVRALRDVRERGGARVTVEDLVDAGSWIALFRTRLLPLHLAIARGEAEGTYADLVGDGNFNFTEAAAESVAQLALSDWEFIDGKTSRDVGSILQQGILNGDSTDTIARSLNRVFRDPARARTVARTETLSAFSQGQLQGAESSGVVATKIWRTSLDDAVRPDHVDTEGQEVPLSGRFVVGAESANAPRDPALSGRNRINCRCFMEFTTGDDV